MTKVAHAGEDHCDTEPVGGLDDCRIAFGAARLNDGGGACLGHGFQAVGKREKRVGSNDGTLKRQFGF